MTIESHQPIHELYCSLTDRDLPCTTQMHFQWNEWKAKGWTDGDLRLVVDHIKDLIRQNRRRPESLRFHNLIGDCDRFNEDLSEARALARRPKTTARDRVLSASGRPRPAPPDAKPAGEIMAQHALMAQLLKGLRESL